MVWILPKLSNYQQVAPSVRTGGSRHTGLAAPPHRNIQKSSSIPTTYPIKSITRGANAGKLRVKQPRSYDSSKVLEVRRQLKEQGYGILCDHSNVFRDEDDRTVVTFSPYHDISSDVAGEIFLPGYDVEISNLSLDGYGTKTVVIRAT